MAPRRGLQQRLALAREQALNRALEPETWKRYFDTYEAYAHLCAAQGLPVRFAWQQLAAWCVFWVQQGFEASTLKNHFSAFSRVADELGMSFPRENSRTKRQLQRLRRGLEKECEGVQHSTPLTRKWIMRMFKFAGVRSLADLELIPPPLLTFLARVSLAHTCMLRMCEHRDGLRVEHVTLVTSPNGDRSFRVSIPEVKDKLRHQPRVCDVPVGSGIHSAGAVLEVFLRVAHPRGEPGILFPRWQGIHKLNAPASESTFKSALRQLAAGAGMHGDELKRLRPHSLRAGGCTDYLSWGANEAWVQVQGGWRSPVYKIYYRPMAADMGYMRKRLLAAEKITAE